LQALKQQQEIKGSQMLLLPLLRLLWLLLLLQLLSVLR
jgi:hypothetical protein